VEIDELVISQAIIDRYFEKLKQNLEVDVAIVGGGPSGLVAGYYLAAAGKRVVLFERKLSIGGGMWGGGMLFNEIVVQQAAMHILEQFGIRLRPYGNGYYTADSVESVACLIAAANETLGTTTDEALIEYVPSGVVRTCVPQPRDRRLMMRAITAAKRVDAGILPKKPRDAPCETCELREYCETKPTPLSENF